MPTSDATQIIREIHNIRDELKEDIHVNVKNLSELNGEIKQVRTLLDEKAKGHERRIEALENSNQWLVRIIMTMVIGAIMGVVLITK